MKVYCRDEGVRGRVKGEAGRNTSKLPWATFREQSSFAKSVPSTFKPHVIFMTSWGCWSYQQPHFTDVNVRGRGTYPQSPP